VNLLERARALVACPLFADLAPAVAVRLAERARAEHLAAGERRSTDDTVWIVASGALAIIARQEVDLSISSLKRKGDTAGPGSAVGLIRIVAPATPVVDAVAQEATVVVALGTDDIRDILEEDPAALSALASALARTLAA